MEARNIKLSILYQLTDNGGLISLSACQQLCIDTEECQAISHITGPKYCSMYSQYTSGSVSDAVTFIKSCSLTYCK